MKKKKKGWEDERIKVKKISKNEENKKERRENINKMEEKNSFKLVTSKKSRFILPNLLTLIGVCLGISSIKFAIDQNYNTAVIFLIFAAILDMLDGRCVWVKWL